MTPEQAKSARLTLGLPRMKVCRMLGITPATLARAERPNSPNPLSHHTAARLQRFYESSGVRFG